MTPVVVRNTNGLVKAGEPAPKPLTVVDAARQELAARLGLSQGRVRSIDPRWGQLLKAGAKVDLHISRARFETTLAWKDMGIEPANEAEEKAMAAVMVPGKRVQLPEQWPESPELKDSGPIQDLDHEDDAARQYLRKHAHRFPWGWMVAEGVAECGLDCGRLEQDELYSAHLQERHPDIYTLYEQALDKAFPTGEIEAEALGHFNAGYPENLGIGGKERGWHFHEVIEELQHFQERYETIGQRIVDNLDALYEAASKHHATIGFQNYERMRALANAKGTLAAFEKTYGTVEEFIHAYVERAMAGRPTDEQAARSFKFQIDVQHVPLASEIELDRLKAAETRSQTVVLESEARVTLAKERARIRVETAEQRVAAEQLEAEANVQAAATHERAAQAAKNERELAATRLKLATEMERTIASQARQRLETEVFSYVDTLRRNLRDTVYGTVVDALAAVKAGDKLPAGSVKGVRNLLDTVSNLDVTDERELRNKLAEINGMLNVKAVDRDDRAIANALREIAAESRLILMDLGATPKRSAAEFGVPDDTDGLFEMLARPEAAITLDMTELEPESRGARPEAVLAL